MQHLTYKFKTMKSPVGVLKLVASDRGIAGVLWQQEAEGRVNLEPQIFNANDAILNTAEIQLNEFFAGKRTEFDLPLDFKGTDFQKAVWAELLNTPFGTLRTYGEIAKAIGRPKAVRAVGAANGKNPIAIIAPCHRIIGSNNTLTGYAGGLEAKALLLKLENHQVENDKQVQYQAQSVVSG